MDGFYQRQMFWSQRMPFFVQRFENGPPLRHGHLSGAFKWCPQNFFRRLIIKNQIPNCISDEYRYRQTIGKLPVEDDLYVVGGHGGMSLTYLNLGKHFWKILKGLRDRNRKETLGKNSWASGPWFVHSIQFGNVPDAQVTDIQNTKRDNLAMKKKKTADQAAFFVGVTGFEPATTRPPDVYANRTAPHPEIFVNILLFDPTCTLTVPIVIADAPHPEFGFEISIFQRKWKSTAELFGQNICIDCWNLCQFNRPNFQKLTPGMILVRIYKFYRILLRLLQCSWIIICVGQK